MAYEAVGLTEFRADNTAAERSYRASTDGMSDAAIKLELSQDRLRRSLAKGPAASQQSARALLQVRQAERELAAETSRTTGQLQRQDRALDQVSRSTRVTGGAFRSLRSGFSIATGGLIGGTGLLFALKSVTSAANEAEKSSGRVAIAVRNAGLDYKAYAQQIERTLAAQSRLSAFDDEALADSFAKLVIRTRDVNKALALNATVADVARGRQISLEAATQLVIKASLGQAGQLRRVGIEVSKNAKAEELLAKLRAAYSGQAEQYANSNAAAQERLNVEYENSREIIGRALTPSIAGLARAAADYLEKANQTGELQRNVNDALETGTEIVHGLADGLKLVKSAADPVIDALGGVENAAQLALIVGLASKARKAAAGFGFIATASSITSRKVVADAARMEVALDAATRPRVVPVTVVQRVGQYGNPIPGGAVGGKKGLPWGILTSNPALITAIVVANAGGASGARTGAYTPDKYPRIAGLLAAAERGFLEPEEQKLLAQFKGQSISELNPAELARLEAGLAKLQNGAAGTGRKGRGSGIVPPRPKPTGSSPGTSGTTGTTREGLTRRQTLELAAQKAELTKSLSDDLRAARDLEAYYAKVASNEKLKGDKLYKARQDLIAAQQRTKSVEDQIEQARLTAQEDAAEKRRKAAEKRRRAAEKIQREQDRQAKIVERTLKGNGPYATTSAGFNKAGVDPNLAARAKAKKDKDAVTQEDLASFYRDMLTGTKDMMDRYFSTFLGGTGAGNALQTHALEQYTIQGNSQRSEQTALLRRMAFRGGRPGDEAVFA